MNCSSVDLKAYWLGELVQPEKITAEDHLRACAGCREELERLKLTESALLSLPEEEVPQRIAFVSDRVFEPRWFETIWRSGPAMGFASAALLAAAILVHAFARPVQPPAALASLNTTQIEQRVEREVNARLDAAVAKAVSETQAKQDRQMTALLEAAEQRFEAKRKTDMAALEQAVRFYDQQINRLAVAYNDQRAGQ